MTLTDQARDLECLRNVQAGESQALAELYDRYTLLLYPMALRILRSPADAEAAIQDAWVQVWRRAATYDPKRGTVAVWLLTVARSRVIDRHRDMASPGRAESRVDVSRHFEEHLDVCAAYALGSLDPGERERFEAHLAGGCPECEKALGEFSAATVPVAGSAPVAEPGAALRKQVLTAVSGTSPVRPARARTDTPGRVIEMTPRPPAVSWTRWVWAAAAVLLAVTSTIFWAETTRLKREIQTGRKQITELSSRLADQLHLDQVMSAPGARVAVFEMTAAGAPTLRARATFDPASRSAVLVFDDFLPPSGHDYQLWAIRGGRPSSLGLIKTGADGHAVLRLEEVGDPASLYAFAVSLERAGGSPDQHAPAGPVIMLGKLSG